MAQQTINADYISFLPFDFLPFMLLAYRRIRPAKLIVIEAELWPNFLMLARLKKVPAYLVNARISKRSKKSHHRFKRFYLPLLSIFTTIYTQSDDDRQEFIALGVDKTKVQTLGDIKAYNVLEKQKSMPQATPTIAPQTLLVGSLHPGELDVYLELFSVLKAEHPALKIIIAPRHFHWKDELIEKVKKTGFRFVVWDEKRLQVDSIHALGGEASWEILLVCKLGELFKLYQNATLFFLGGTFIPIGGHNLLEPAVWANPMIVGPYHDNCRVIARKLAQQDALIAVSSSTELIQVTRELLQNRKRLKAMGDNARKWLESEAKQVESALKDFISFSSPSS